jgi:hypothetical protein
VNKIFVGATTHPTLVRGHHEEGGAGLVFTPSCLSMELAQRQLLEQQHSSRLDANRSRVAGRSESWASPMIGWCKAAGCRVGLCGLTISPGECHLGDYGFFENGASDSLESCRRACRTCARCAFVSWSAKNRDCSWYASCDMDDLRRPPKGAPDYVTYHERTAAPPVKLWPGALRRHLDPTRGGLSIGIATTVPPNTRSACSLVQWCERASLFARALRGLGWSASVVVLAEPGQKAPECSEGVEMIPLDPRLVWSVRRCEKRTPVSGDGHPARMGPILKFGAVKLTQFDLVFFTDSDVGIVPESNLRDTARRWATMAPALLNASWPELISNADSMSPINGGAWIVRPSIHRYAEGLRVLHRCRFNSTHGWDLVGRPRSLGLQFRHVDGREMPPTGGDTGDSVLFTDAFKRDDWTFVGADSDQGFLFYLYHVLGRQGAYFRWKANKHRVLHWRGSANVGLPKPWLLAMDAPTTPSGIVSSSHLAPLTLSRAYVYMSYSMTGLLSGGAPNATPCVRALWRFRRAIEDEPPWRWHKMPMNPGLITVIPYVAAWR